MENPMATRTSLAVLLGALVLSPVLSPAPGAASDDARSLEQMAIESAHSPGDHAAIAVHYRAKAEKARAEKAHHASMRRIYAGGKQGNRAGGFHCKRLAARFGSIAAEYDELAKLHESEGARGR